MVEDIYIKQTTEPVTIWMKKSNGEYKPSFMYFPDSGDMVPYMDVRVSIGGGKQADAPIKRSSVFPVLVPDEQGKLIHMFDYDLNRCALRICKGVHLCISEKGVTLGKEDNVI